MLIRSFLSLVLRESHITSYIHMNPKLITGMNWPLSCFPVFVYLFSSQCAGGYYSSLFFFCLLHNWSTISEPWEGTQGSQAGHVRPCFHLAAVLLLHWLAQGKMAHYHVTCTKQIFFWIRLSDFIFTRQVGELIINPFGEDDDDFETNQLIDRNIQVVPLRFLSTAI